MRGSKRVAVDAQHHVGHPAGGEGHGLIRVNRDALSLDHAGRARRIGPRAAQPHPGKAAHTSSGPAGALARCSA
jgi:hypothetical protein